MKECNVSIGIAWYLEYFTDRIKRLFLLISCYF